MEKKICIKCNINYSLDFFPKRKDSKDGHRNECKTCWKLKTQDYLKKNPHKKKEYNKRWLSKVPEYNKEFYSNNKEYFLEKRIRFTNINPNYNKGYYENNKKYFSDYVFVKYNNNNLYRLSHLTRNRIKQFLKSKNITKNNSTYNIVGCSPEFLKEHIEKQFTDGMSWDKMGKYIHIDHIIPLSSAETEEEIYKLCHYTNLQPLWAEDNLKKSNKIIN
jgi:hypothetical protein